MPATMPFVRLCKAVAEAYSLVSVQRCYLSAGVRKDGGGAAHVWVARP